jgi:imidazole glycerol-phosphate synthase subunit HisH
MSTHRAAIALVDLGLGNLASVHKALARAATDAGFGEPLLTHDPDVIARADRVVVPGQGAYRDGVVALDAAGGAMRSVLTDVIARGTPYLGICLGLQLLLDSSEEAPGARGLGIFSGSVRRIPDGAIDTSEGRERRLKVPHMGWNQPRVVAGSGGSVLAPLLARAGEAPWFYFVHSYHAVPDDRSLVAATCDYGALAVTAALARDHVIATQFHPEKSQRAGLALLEGFLEHARPGRAA